MMKVVSSLLVVVLIIFSGCSYTMMNQRSKSLYVTISTDLLADIEVDINKKLSGTSSSSYFLGFFQVTGETKFTEGIFSMLTLVGKVKSAAAYNAVKGSGADVLINPSYVVEDTNYLLFREIDVTVTGYAGKIKGFKVDEHGYMRGGEGVSGGETLFGSDGMVIEKVILFILVGLMVAF